MDRSATQLIELGRSLMAERAWEEARAVLTEALELDPDSEAFVLRGWCCSYLGELDEAIAACRFDRMLDVGRFTPLPSAVRRALSWIRENVSPTGGILVHSRHWSASGYPEVTGYLVPTLLEYGEHHLADEFVEWLLQAQEPDGSFRAPDGHTYVFDVAQVLRGFNACAKMPGKERIIDAVRRAADFMLGQAVEGGSAGFCPQYKGIYADIPESILLYAAGPLKEAGVLTGEAKYIDVAERCFSFYSAQPYAFAPATLTHYLGYELEAAIDWGRRDLVEPVLDRLAGEMTPAGAVRGKPGVEWVCPPGTAQLAVCWYKIGQRRYGDCAMAWLERHQRPSGGWPGSMGPGASYAADVEPSWSVKYYLDAHRLRVTEFMRHNADRVSPFEVPECDGRWDAILNCVSSGPVLEVGCGRGRWLKLLKDLRPDASLAGVDPSRELLSAVPDGIERKVGSFEAIPYPDSTFEVVIAVDALAHCSGLEYAVRELVRVTRPGGVILIIDKDRRHQGRLVCPPWEEWIDRVELTRALSEVCDGFEEENISYAGGPADGLMVSWRARKEVTAGTAIRKPSEKPGISPQPLGWLEERTTEKREWSVGRLSQNIGTYRLTAFGRIAPGSELQRLNIGPYSATGRRSIGEIKLSLRLPAALFDDSRLVPVQVKGVDLARVLVVPTGLGDLAIRSAKLGKYEAIMTLPLAKALVARQLYREAVGLLECVIALHKDIGEAYYLLGVSLTVLGERVEDALTAYDKALALNFSEFWILYNRGALYLKLSEREKARRDLSRAAELDPNHEGIRRMCKAFESEVWDDHRRPFQDQGQIRKFVLIDHSIRDMTGHFYEYAAHVLQAARNAQYKPILATNRRFKEDSRSRDARWEVHPIYTYGFWMQLSPPWWHAPAVALKRWVNTRWGRIYIRLAFSRWNLDRLLARDLSVYFRCSPTASRSWQLVAWAYTRTAALAAWQLVVAVTPFRAYLKGIASAGIAFVRALLLPLGRVLRPPQWLRRVLYDRQRASAFERETARLLSRLRLTDHDIVFLPTTSEIEMLGLGRILARWRSDARPSWHVVFRVGFGDGSFAEELRGSDAYRPLRNAMFAFQELSKGHRVAFYTDTDLLTEKYNSLGILHFETIPIPHTRSNAAAWPHEQPLRVVYLGDARAEKGYHHLPRLIGDLWEPYVQRGDVSFVIQSNFNIPEGEPEAVIARRELEAFPSDRVQLLCSPLSTDAYAELLLSADLVVLPYDASCYYARSSGIAVEALAAGIPVVVPAGTWMARQFAEASNRHAEDLISEMRVLRSRESTRMRWRRHGEPRWSAQTDEEIVFGGESAHTYAWLAAPPGATHMLVCFECSPANVGTFIRVTAHQQTWHGLTLRRTVAIVGGVPRMAAVLPLHNEGGKVYLALRNAWDHQMVHIFNLAVHFVTPVYPGRTPPLSAVGTVFAQPDELSATVREVLDHYSHYRETAQMHARAILGLHNPQRLIALLEGKQERRLLEVGT